MYLWQKRATPDWLDRYTDTLGPSAAIIERPGKKRTLVELTCASRKEALRLRQALGGSIEKLRANWLQRLARKERKPPLRIGSRLTVARTTGPDSIVIPAEAAFGTGEHATTAMCLRMLERITRRLAPGWSMLDAGTGSGILAIAGSRFGAGRIVAIDNDPRACVIAERNARANDARRIEFKTGDVLNTRPKGKFDIITANLFSEILIAGLPFWLPHLARDGWLIFSGVLRSQERSLVAALKRNHCRSAEIRRRGKWVALLASRTRKRS